MKRLIGLISLQIVILFLSCSSDDLTDCIPNISVNQRIFIGNITALQITGAHVFGGIGVKGIVVKRNSISPPEFRAYDIQAPHLCPSEECSTLELNEDFIILSGCDGAQFLLSDGQPISISNRGLIEYFVSFDPRSNEINIGARR